MKNGLKRKQDCYLTGKILSSSARYLTPINRIIYGYIITSCAAAKTLVLGEGVQTLG